MREGVDLNERYEEMNRMREEVYSEVDKDRDQLVSLQEFLDWTNTAEFEKDDGDWPVLC